MTKHSIKPVRILCVFVMLAVTAGSVLLPHRAAAQATAPQITSVDVFPLVCPHQGCTLAVRIAADDAASVTFGGQPLAQTQPGMWTGSFESEVNSGTSDMLGHYEIVASNAAGSTTEDSPRIRVAAQQNEGKLRFEGETPTLGTQSSYVAAGVDSRGWAIIAVADRSTGTINVYGQRAAFGVFDRAEQYSVNPQENGTTGLISFVALADVTDDGCDDLVSGALYTGFWVFPGCRPGGAALFGDPLPMPPLSVSGGAVVDYTGDGRADILAASGNMLWLYISDGAGRFHLLQVSNALYPNNSPLFDKVAVYGNLAVLRDGSSMLLAGFRYEGPGDVPTFLISETDRVTEATVADIDGDGLPDVAAITDYGNRIHLYLQQPDGSFERQQVDASGTYYSITNAVVNGRQSLVVAKDSMLVVYSWNGTGFDAPAPVTSGLYPGACTSAHLNGDLLQDILCGLNGTQTPSGAPYMVWTQIPAAEPVRRTPPILFGVPSLSALPYIWALPGRHTLVEVTLTNTGAAALSWQAQNPDFTVVQPSSGVLAPGESIPLTLDIFVPTGEPQRVHHTPLVITNGVRDFVTDVEIDINQVAWWNYDIQPASLSKTLPPGEQATAQAVLTNTGRASRYWENPADNAAWLSVTSPYSYFLEPGQAKTLDITWDSTGMEEGEYEAVITIYQPGGIPPMQMEVEMVVFDGDMFAAMPGSLSFKGFSGSGALQQGLLVTNLTGHPQPWTAVSSLPWLSLDAPNGTVGANGSFTLTAAVDTHAVAPGNYTGAITIANGAFSTTIPVFVAIAEQPKVYLPILTR